MLTKQPQVRRAPVVIGAVSETTHTSLAMTFATSFDHGRKFGWCRQATVIVSHSQPQRVERLGEADRDVRPVGAAV